MTHQQESNFKRVGRSGKKETLTTTVALSLQKQSLSEHLWTLQKKPEICKTEHVEGVCMFVFLFCSYIFSLHYGKHSKYN